MAGWSNLPGKALLFDQLAKLKAQQNQPSQPQVIYTLLYNRFINALKNHSRFYGRYSFYRAPLVFAFNVYPRLTIIKRLHRRRFRVVKPVVVAVAATITVIGIEIGRVYPSSVVIEFNNFPATTNILHLTTKQQ